MDQAVSKEQVYDNEIFPLMNQIIGICQKHKIAMVASFCVETEGDPGLHCTTALLSDEYNPSTAQRVALASILKGVV